MKKTTIITLFCNKLQFIRIGVRENNEDGSKRNQRRDLLKSGIFQEINCPELYLCSTSLILKPVQTGGKCKAEPGTVEFSVRANTWNWKPVLKVINNEYVD